MSYSCPISQMPSVIQLKKSHILMFKSVDAKYEYCPNLKKLPSLGEVCFLTKGKIKYDAN